MATDTTVRDALIQAAASVAGVKTVTAGISYRVTRRGGVIPSAADCPTVRISGGAVRVLPLELSGKRSRYETWEVALWAYEDDPTLAGAAWDDLRAGLADALAAVRQTLRGIPGVLDGILEADEGGRRPLGAAGNRGLLHTLMRLTTWERV